MLYEVITQPTVTRRRAMLEENYIEGYTVIPKFGQIGFEIASITFLKSKIKYQRNEDKTQSLAKMKEWYLKQPRITSYNVCYTKLLRLNH